MDLYSFRNELAENGVELTCDQIKSSFKDLKKACNDSSCEAISKEEAIFKMAQMGIEISPNEYDSLVQLILLVQEMNS